MALSYKEISTKEHEYVLLVEDKEVGLKGIIAIHDTTMGPALGGIRFYPYQSFEAGLNDVLRLSKGMTYKSVLAEASLGGGKSVVFWDPKKPKPKELLMAFGEAIDSLGGRYYGAEDSGCFAEDLVEIRKKTPYLVGIEQVGSSGNPAPYTAWGSFRGIQAAVGAIGENEVDFTGLVFAVQGLGSVGMRICEHLYWMGANIMVTDVCPDLVEEARERFCATAVKPDEIFDVKCDIFVPCAMGGVLNTDTVKRLRCRAVAGCANNQLANSDIADQLMEKGTLYTPDFIINAGGLINVAEELKENGYSPKAAIRGVNNIHIKLKSIFEAAKLKGCSTEKAAIDLADHQLKSSVGKKQEKLYIHHTV